MKVVFKEYGVSVITVVVALLLIFHVFTNLSWNVLDKGLQMRKENFAEYEDSRKIVQVMERKRPVIRCRDISVKVGSTWHVSDLLEARDIDGNLAEIEVLKIIDSTGNTVNVTDNYIFFAKKGIYQILVRAKDDYCRETGRSFCLPVMP